MVVADSGLVSKDIIIGVNEKYYEYIIGKKNKKNKNGRILGPAIWNKIGNREEILFSNYIIFLIIITLNFFTTFRVHYNFTNLVD